MIRIYAAAALLAAPAVAQAQQQCIPPQQVGDAAVVAAPFLIDGVAGACKAHVPAGAFLNSGAAAFSQRLRSEGAPRVESAVSVLKLMGGGKDIPEIEDPAALLTIIGTMVQAMLAPQIPPESCVGLSGAIEALAPLPADNIALLGSSIATAIAATEEKKAAERAAKAAAAAEAGESEPDPAVKRSGPKICPNG